ncbi:hypothetical protein VTN49DRAFT_1973 [Thermomyces lanuginosus]|uniref:uncharacterized protein n=1 Tax=Thermomyces lanuginosus TaxID=5541 RepID=UPI00374376BF
MSNVNVFAAANGRYFSAPSERNVRFVGRERILEQLLAIVPPSMKADDCQRVAIVGPGGVGKTQIALELASRIRQIHPNCSVFWASGMDAISFGNSYKNIDRSVDIRGPIGDKATVEDIVKENLSLEDTRRWLLIVDNADNPEFSTKVAHHLPSNHQGSVLVISRDRDLVARLHVPKLNILSVEGMSEDESFKLLKTLLKERHMCNRDDTATFLEVLEYLPLAIRLASAYIAKKKITTTKYLEHWRSSDIQMVKSLSKTSEKCYRSQEVPNPITTAWLISFRQITFDDPLAADYLKFMCLLSDEAPISRSLLPEDSHSLEAEDAIETLKAYSFITEREESVMYDVHRLVRLAMLNWMDKQGELDEWKAKVIRRVEEAFPIPLLDKAGEWTNHLPHARHVLEHQKTEEEATINLLSKLGCSYEILGQYREAETMLRRVLEGQEKMLGPNDPAVLNSISHLGAFLEKRQQYKKAEAMYRRALEGREKVFGSAHPTTLADIHSLGVVLEKQGHWILAEIMYRKALEGREKVLGPDNPCTLKSVFHLAAVLQRQGKNKEAEAMNRRVPEGQKKVLGLDHPDTLKSLSLFRTLPFRTKDDTTSQS